MPRVKLRISAAVVAIVMCVAAALPLCACGKTNSTSDLPAHLITKPDESPERPIDSAPERALTPCASVLDATQYRVRVNELYSTVVDYGCKPVFIDNDPIKPVYDAAIAMLDRYVLNAWHADASGEVRIVHTIHDWLIQTIEYDFALYDAYNRGETVDDTAAAAFGIDGVFLNNLAVCDGLSRAVSFLCAVEGIESMRVTGTFMGTPHAWNKVKIGEKWYNVDVTADAANYTVDDGSNSVKYKKQLTHGYLLLSDDTYAAFGPNGRAGAHEFERTVECDTDYDYYANQTIRIGGETFSMTITDQTMLNNLFYAVRDEKGKVGKLEVKLAFEGKTNVNDGDVYEAEIRTAYNKLKSPDFAFTATQKPYFRYPNGVYVFLMYR